MTSSDLSGVLALMGIIWGGTLLLGIGFYIWYAIALSKLFPRLGGEGWRGWVPILQEYEILQRGGLPGWQIVFAFVPVVQLYYLVLKYQAAKRIGALLGHPGGGLALLAPIFPPLWATLVQRDAPAAPAAPLGDRVAAGIGGDSGMPVPPVPGVGAGLATPAPVPPAPEPLSPSLATSATVPNSSVPPVPPAPVVPVSPTPLPPTGAAPAEPIPAPGLAPMPPVPPVPQPVAAQPVAEPPAPPAEVAPPAPASPPPVAPAPGPVTEPPALVTPPPLAPHPLVTPPAPAEPEPQPVVTPPPGFAPPPPAAAPPPAARPAVPFLPPLVDDDDEAEETIIVDRRPRIRWRLEVGDAVFPLESDVVVLGRRPASADAGVQALAVPDTTRTLSKTHARLERRDEQWIITDLNSTNGVVVLDAAGEELLLDEGASAPVATGRFILGRVEMRLACDDGAGSWRS